MAMRMPDWDRMRERARRVLPWAGGVLAVLALLLSARLATGPHPAGLQSSATPYGLSTRAQVQAAGSDLRSFVFRVLELPGFMKLSAREFSNEAYRTRFERIKLDPNRLRLEKGGAVRVYFVGESAGTANSLGVNLSGVGVHQGDPFLLFPAVGAWIQLSTASAVSGLLRFLWFAYGVRAEKRPLKPGDFVELGELPAGTTLSFFLINNNEVFSPLPVFTPVAAENPDRIPHMVAYAVENSPYLLFSFEDTLNGGDADYADAVFALEMSPENIGALLGRYDPWGYARRLILRVGLITFVFWGPLLYVTVRETARRMRIRGRRAQAERCLEGGDPHGALAVIDRTLGLLTAKERAAWQAMTLQAARQGGDVAHLLAVHDDAPTLLQVSEPLSLHTARALLLTDRPADGADLRAAWRGREKDPSAWAALEARCLARMKRTQEAVALFQSLPGPGTERAAALADIAAVLSETDPGRGRELAARALAEAPGSPDALAGAAVVAARLGDPEAARRHAETALRLAPRDPLIRAWAAQFLCREGRHAEAAEVFAGGLAPPSLDTLWSGFLFWTRVAVSRPVDLSGLPVPPGPRSRLAVFLRDLPGDRFWDPVAFDRLAGQHPHLASFPEAWWLGLLEMLRTGNLSGARSALTVESGAGTSWQPDLEAALLRVVMLRQTDTLGFETARPGGAPRPVKHAFFAELDEAALSGGMGLSPNMMEFLKGDFAFAAACLAAGWNEAALRLYPHPAPPHHAPNWARAAFLHAGEQSRRA